MGTGLGEYAGPIPVPRLWEGAEELCLSSEVDYGLGAMGMPLSRAKRKLVWKRNLDERKTADSDLSFAATLSLGDILIHWSSTPWAVVALNQKTGVTVGKWERMGWRAMLPWFLYSVVKLG